MHLYGKNCKWKGESNRMLFIIGVLIAIVECYLMVKMLEVLCPVKETNNQRTYFVVGCLVFASVVLNKTFEKNMFINFIPLIVMLVYAHMYLKGTLVKKGITSLFVFVNVLVINGVFIVIGAIFNQSAYSLIYEDVTLVYMLTVASKLFLFLEYSYIQNFTDKEIPINKETWKSILIILILSFIAIILTINEFVNRGISTVYVGIVIITFILVNLLIFKLCLTVSKHAIDKANQDLYIKSMEYEEKLLDVIKDKTDELRKVNHDFKHHISVLNNMINDDSQEMAKEYLNTIELPSSSEYVHTNNTVLNYVLNERIGIAKKLGIDVRREVLGKDMGYINNVDISIILGNLLDNAIEACKDVKGRKFIDIKIAMDEHKTVYTIKNSTVMEKMAMNAEMPTTKKDKKSHGYGMKNIEAAVEKYDGESFYSAKGYVFTHICILNHIKKQ